MSLRHHQSLLTAHTERQLQFCVLTWFVPNAAHGLMGTSDSYKDETSELHQERLEVLESIGSKDVLRKQLFQLEE